MKHLLTALFILTVTCCFGQNSIIIERKSNPDKFKVLNINSEYIVKTQTNTYKGRIKAFNHTTFTMMTNENTGKDTTYVYYQGRKEIKKVRPVYANFTKTIPYKEVLYLKKDLFDNRKWLEPFAFGGLAAGLGLVLLPVVAIDKGSAGVKELLGFEIIILAVSAPPLLIGTRKVTYDLKNKWNLKTKMNSIP